jgi:hypothetical protein
MMTEVKRSLKPDKNPITISGREHLSEAIFERHQSRGQCRIHEDPHDDRDIG